ncbi:WG repeat-containing protein [Dysgonomonas sp. 25]|uniref:WG repeat-containing protein n=1 Tax=Dysgonomonas sp. 25 TaxID=2302933 RepID=UPI0013D8A9DA|nr:WG repeat-containing protein [Dysgonomonas sp. 25]NDV67661.1 hypothetical protein [Dysgonomonas sp. 25]
MRKLLISIFLLITCTNLFAWQPDSVYVTSRGFYLLHYIDKAVQVHEVSFDERNRMVIEHRIVSGRDSSLLAKPLFGYDQFRLNVDCEQELLGKKIPLSYEYGYHDYTFFAPDRYATVRHEEGRSDHFTVSNAWKQESVGELNFGILYDLHLYFQGQKYRTSETCPFDPDEYEYEVDGVILPMKDGRYLLVADYMKDTICIPQKHTYDPVEMLYSRQLHKDTDTLRVNGKYGLYTITGKEVIPAIYDSLKLEEVLARGFRNGRVDLINYMGEKVRENLQAAYPVVYRYQILEDNGRMYFMDNKGNETDDYSYSFMSTDDQILPLGLDVILLPPKTIKGYPKKRKYKQYTWVSFYYPGDYRKFEALKRLQYIFPSATEEDLKLLKIPYAPGSWEVYQYSIDFEENVVKRYGLDRYEWYGSTYGGGWDQRHEMYGYEIEAYDLPEEYKDPKLISGTNECYYGRTLPVSWIIAKKNGKYGVFDVRENNKEILPFVYDKIDAGYQYLVLYRKGLKTYYPVSNTPKYKVLEPFNWNLARFQLADGRWGWLAKDGKEFIDK